MISVLWSRQEPRAGQPSTAACWRRQVGTISCRSCTVVIKSNFAAGPGRAAWAISFADQRSGPEPARRKGGQVRPVASFQSKSAGGDKNSTPHPLAISIHISMQSGLDIPDAILRDAAIRLHIFIHRCIGTVYRCVLFYLFKMTIRLWDDSGENIEVVRRAQYG